MSSKGILIMAFAVFGAYAKPMINSGFQSNGFNAMNGAYTSLPVVNAHVPASVVENPTIRYQTYVPANTDSCHCLKTVVRPQIRNELIAVPAISDGIVRTVSPPVVQTVNFGGARRIEIPSCSQSNGILSGVTGGRTYNELFHGNNGNFNEVGASIFNGAGTGTTFTTCQGTNSGTFNGAAIASFNGANGGTIGFHGSNSGSILGSNTGIFSGNSAFSNGARIGGF